MFIDPVFGVVGLVVVVLTFIFLRRFLHLGKIEKIEKLIEEKNFDKAIEPLKSMIIKDDENVLAHYYLGICYFNTNNYEWAIPEFKKVIRNPGFGKQIKEIEVREKLAKIYLHYNQLEEAQKEFLLMTQLDPKNYKNYYEIAQILQKQGFLDAALTYYQKTLERNPKLPEAYYNVGLISYDKKKYNDALSHFSDALKYDTALHKAHYYIGMIQYMNKNYEKALGEFAYSERDSEMRPKTILQKGKIYIEMGQMDRAINVFDGYLKNISSENSVTLAMHYNLASAFEMKRNIISAIEQWEKIVKIKPSYMDVQDKLSEYEHLRVDDRIKDFIVASKEGFQIMSRNIVEMWNYQIIKEDMLDDENIEFLATEAGSKWRNTRKIRILILISRKNNKVEERELANIIDNMKINNTMKSVYVSVSGFTDNARQYAQNRPIDLIDKEKMTKVLEQADIYAKDKIKNKLSKTE
ncbi:MAG TPA: hypothetical protein DHW82_08705 [Spirochaetia bacterium]|nr:MAG: hypothetical protein A2Y41_05060 [Spirochaetes bacterium GWB1_36_13]HCL57070.1 hypothetical protein [Spirochaetia bacterium]